MSGSGLEEIARSGSIVWSLTRVPKLKPWRVISEPLPGCAIFDDPFCEAADFATRNEAVEFSLRAAAIALDKGL